MNDHLFVFKIKKDTKIINKNDIKAARVGEIIHDKKIRISSLKFNFLYPTDTNPAPNKLPITVCVPLIGIPKFDANMIKTKEQAHTENIIKFNVYLSKVSRS